MTYGVRLEATERKTAPASYRDNSRYPDTLDAMYLEDKDIIDTEVDPDVYWFDFIPATEVTMAERIVYEKQ